MNWSFVGRALIFGFLGALWGPANAILAMESMPTPWGWVKLAAGAVIGFVGGVYLYSRDPDAAWKAGPGAKVGVALILTVGLVICGASGPALRRCQSLPCEG